VIESLKKAPSGIKIGKEQLNVLAYADDIVLNGKDETESRPFFRNRKYYKNIRNIDKPWKNKICDSGTGKQIKTK